jgi:transcriptional regulator with XRE-family HTH domain
MDGRMDERLAFLRRLRRQRERQGISLEAMAEATNVSVGMWSAFEENDFARWPTGVFARAFVREYAIVVGLDPEDAVDDFCRWFPQGDRRAERMLRAQAELIGHNSEWRDEWDRTRTPKDRRRPALRLAARAEDQPARKRRRRVLAACIDLAVISATASLAHVAGLPTWPSLSVTALGYHIASTIAFGGSAGPIFVERYLDRLAALLPLRREAHA